MVITGPEAGPRPAEEAPTQPVTSETPDRRPRTSGAQEVRPVEPQVIGGLGQKIDAGDFADAQEALAAFGEEDPRGPTPAPDTVRPGPRRVPSLAPDPRPDPTEIAIMKTQLNAALDSATQALNERVDRDTTFSDADKREIKKAYGEFLVKVKNMIEQSLSGNIQSQDELTGIEDSLFNMLDSWDRAQEQFFDGLKSAKTKQGRATPDLTIDEIKSSLSVFTNLLDKSSREQAAVNRDQARQESIRTMSPERRNEKIQETLNSTATGFSGLLDLIKALFPSLAEWANKMSESLWANRYGINNEQHKMFCDKVLPYLQLKQINLGDVKQQNDIAQPRIMKSLARLGIPIPESANFLGYILGDRTDADLPAEGSGIFKLGRDEAVNLGYIGGPNGRGPANLGELMELLEAIPVPTAAPTTAPGSVPTGTPGTAPSGQPTAAPTGTPTGTVAEGMPTTPVEGGKLKITIDGKDIIGTPNNINGYNELAQVAEKLFKYDGGFKKGEKYTAATTGMASDTERYGDAGLKKAGASIFREIIGKLKTVYGNDVATKLVPKPSDAEIKLLTELSYTDGDLESKDVSVMSKVLDDNLGKVFVYGAEKLGTDIFNWAKNKGPKVNEAANLMKSSIEGKVSNTNEINSSYKVPEVLPNGGLGELVLRNMVQMKNFEKEKGIITSEEEATRFINERKNLPFDRINR